MQELYSIMRELLEVEYNQESLRYIIKMLEAAYGQEDQGKENLIVSGVTTLRFYTGIWELQSTGWTAT